MGTLLSDQEKKEYEQVTKNMGDAECSFSVRALCSYLFRYYGKKQSFFWTNTTRPCRRRTFMATGQQPTEMR